jgi:hypothetical protein
MIFTVFAAGAAGGDQYGFDRQQGLVGRQFGKVRTVRRNHGSVVFGRKGFRHGLGAGEVEFGHAVAMENADMIGPIA